MATHLLVWNPDRWSWTELPDLLHGFMHGRPVTARWSCGSNRRVRARDRFFLVRLNRFPTGVFASGRIMRGAHEAHDLVAQDSGRTGGLFVEVRFDMLANPDGQMPLARRELSHGALGRFRWEEGVSGRTLPEEVAAELEAAWANHFGAAVAGDSASAAAPKASTAAKPGLKVKAPAPPPVPPPARPTSAESAAAEVIGRMFEALFLHYFEMLEAAVRGEVLGQAGHLTALMAEFGGLSESIVRDRYAEVGAVLRQCGLPFLDVYPPADTPGRKLRRHLVRFLDRNRPRLERIWPGEDALSRVRVRDELVDLQGAWAPPPLDTDFKVEAFLAGRARFPSFGGFQRREDRWAALREGGCRFALAFERARLKQAQCDALANRIRLLDPDEARSAGYDMLSFNSGGDARYIRVSTTQYSRRFPLLLDPPALLASYRHGEDFFLYRVFHFCWDAKLYMVQGDLRESLRFMAERGQS
ncbi:MAG TPA: DUF3883 domain-containing protein [Gammaproteobacteria bacterium]|nr:DUF3883 domain-containing protein [Gammaproteobacteria bacterium]